MQKALTPVNSLGNDCFADYAVEKAEESDTPLSSVSIGGRPLCNSGLPMISICSEAVKKNCNNSLKDWGKQRLNTEGISAPTRAKFSSTAPSQDHLPTYR